MVNGAKEKGLENAFWFDNQEALVDKIEEIAQSGDVLVFKASRAMHLENVISELYKRWES